MRHAAAWTASGEGASRRCKPVLGCGGYSTMSVTTFWRRPAIASSHSPMARCRGGEISISWRTLHHSRHFRLGLRCSWTSRGPTCEQSASGLGKDSACGCWRMHESANGSRKVDGRGRRSLAVFGFFNRLARPCCRYVYNTRALPIYPRPGRGPAIQVKLRRASVGVPGHSSGIQARAFILLMPYPLAAMDETIAIALASAADLEAVR